MSARDPEPSEAALALAAGVRRLARAVAADAQEAEDLAQEAWLRALRRRPWARGEELGGWFRCVLANLARNARRGGQRRREREEGAARPEPQPSSAELIERAELHGALVAELTALREPYREALLLRYLESLPPRAIAARLGVPVATVNARLARGLVLLRERLDAGRGGRERFLALAALARRPAVLGGGLWTMTKPKLAAALAAIALIVAVPWAARDLAPGPREAVAELETGRNPVADEVERTNGGALNTPTRTSAAPAVAASTGSDSALRGVVLAPDGSPARGLAVELWRRAAGATRWLDAGRLGERALARAETDAGGAFRFEVDPDRAYLLRAPADPHPFYARIERDGCRGGELVTLQLELAATVLGRLTDAESGEGVEAARVFLFDASDADAPRRLAEATTDARGDFRFDGLGPGLLALEVRASAHVGEPWLSFALAPGEERRIDLALGRGFTLRGRVSDAQSGLPIEGAEVSDAWTFARVARTDARGEYELRGCGAASDMRVRAPGYGAREALAPSPVDCVARLDLELARGRSASGTLVDARGRPVAGAYVAAMASEHAGALQRFDRRSTTTGADGRFELDDLRPDLGQTLVLRADGHGALLRELECDEDRSAIELDDVGRARVELGVLRLAPGARLRGLALEADGGAVAGAAVELRGPLAHDLGGLEHYLGGRTARSDAAGRFRFADVAEGEYELRAHLDGRRDEPSALFSIAAGELRDDVELRFAAGAGIAGRAIDSSGRAAAGLVLLLDGGALAGFELRATTALDGSFAFGGLESGRYRLRSLRPRPVPGSPRLLAASLEQVAAGAEHVTLLVPRSAPIAGRVLDATGAPAAGAFVLAHDARGQQVGRAQADTRGRFEVDAPEGELVELRAHPTEPGPTAGSYRSVLAPERAARLAEVRAGARDVELRLP